MSIIDQQAFRDVVPCMGTTVNIATMDGSVRCIGLAASTVCSVTDMPPILLARLNREVSVRSTFSGNRTLCVNTSSAGQEPLSNFFGGKMPMEHRFATTRWQAGVTGCP